MALVGFQYEPVSLDVVFALKKSRILCVKNQEKVKTLLNDADLGNEG